VLCDTRTMTTSHQPSSPSATEQPGSNRREVLLGAAGLAVAAGVVAAGSSPAAATVGPMTLVIGDRTIEVLAWSWGVSNSSTTHTGAGSGAGKANVQDLSITKYVDGASADLLRLALEGTITPKATLTVPPDRKVGGVLVTLEIREFLVTSLSTGGSGGEDRLTENVTFNFAELTYTAGGAPVEYDIVEGPGG
jgi:type VI protein secretion system component Hcp